MADSNFNHLINIIFRTTGSQTATREVQKVQKSIKVPWDSKAVSNYENNVRKALGVLKDTSKETTKARSSTNDFVKALRRAAIVAPVWQALRTVMNGVIRGIQEGIRYWEEFDRALVKARAVVHESATDMATTMKDLEVRIQNLSQTTGESMTKIASAFYRFGTVGEDFETAWAGAEAAVRFALATQGDADQVAQTMALTFKLLGNTMDDTIPITQRFNAQFAKQFKLWQVNAFEADQLTQSFKQFLPTANTLGLSLDETTALLATLNSAALQGSRGGRLLRTSFTKLIDNSDKLADSLGLAVNPELDNTFELFTKVLKSIKDLSSLGELPIEAQRVISDLFGGVRGGEPVKALIALYDTLQQNLAITTTEYSDLSDTLQNYDKRIQDVNNSVSKQLEIFRELRSQAGRSFVIGITGAEDYVEALQKVNDIMKVVVQDFRDAGDRINRVTTDARVTTLAILTQGLALSKFFDPLYKELDNAEDRVKKFEQIQFAFQFKSSLQDVNSLIKDLSENDYGIDNLEFFLTGLTNVKKRLEDNIKFQKETDQVIIDFNNKYIQKQTEQNQIIEHGLRLAELGKKANEDTLEIVRLQSLGYSESQIEIAKITKSVNEIVDKYNSLKTLQGDSVTQLNKQEIVSLVLAKNWEKILELTKNNTAVRESLLKVSEQLADVDEARIKTVDTLVKHELDLARMRGANALQLLALEANLNSLLYGEDQVANSLEYQLRLEKELTAQKLAQNEATSEQVTLFKIAQRFGTSTAFTAARFLTGQVTPTGLDRRTLLALRRFAPGQLEAGQAAEFFRNEGRVINQVLQNVPVDIEVQPIQVNIDSENIIRKIKERLANEIDTQESSLNRAIRNVIEKF